VVQEVGLGDVLDSAAHDLLYVGGGQDREQALIAPDLATKADGLRTAHARGVAMLAVCGGYQLLGRGYRGRDGSFMPGASIAVPVRNAAGQI
jgi:CobQ-like glutamine amidotransferase family enzyme